MESLHRVPPCRFESELQLRITIPPSFPLRRATVAFERMTGIPESRWRFWELRMASTVSSRVRVRPFELACAEIAMPHVYCVQDGSLRDALQLWRANLDREFSGIEPCPICYQALSASNGQLPKAGWCAYLLGSVCSNDCHRILAPRPAAQRARKSSTASACRSGLQRALTRRGACEEGTKSVGLGGNVSLLSFNTFLSVPLVCPLQPYVQAASALIELKDNSSWMAAFWCTVPKLAYRAFGALVFNALLNCCNGCGLTSRPAPPQ